MAVASFFSFFPTKPIVLTNAGTYASTKVAATAAGADKSFIMPGAGEESGREALPVWLGAQNGQARSDVPMMVSVFRAGR